MGLDNYTQIKKDLKWAIEQIRCMQKAFTIGLQGRDQNNIFRVIKTYYLADIVEGDTIDRALYTINNSIVLKILEIENYLVVLNPNLSLGGEYSNITDKFLIKNLGKNMPTENYGLGGIQLTRDNLEFISTSIVSTPDIIDENTQFIIISDLGGLTISQYVNLEDPSLDIQNLNEGSVIFNVGVTPNITQYWFVAEGGLYGLNDLQTIDDNFVYLNETGAEDVFTSDIQVILDDVDSAGPYRNGDVFPATGLGWKESITKLLQAVIDPTLIAPTFSMTLSGSTTAQEVGSTFTGTLVGNFVKGRINGLLISGVWSSSALQNYRTGDVVSYTLDSTTQISNSLAFTRVMTLGNNVVSGSVTHETGPQPINSAGNAFSVPYPAGSVIASNITIVASYPVFYGTINSSEIITICYLVFILIKISFYS